MQLGNQGFQLLPKAKACHQDHLWLDDYRPLESKSSSPPVLHMQSKKDPLQKSLKRLWEFDKVPDTMSLSPNNQAVMQHFHDTYRIEPDGQYVVELPRTAD